MTTTKPITISPADVPAATQYVDDRVQPVGDCLEWTGPRGGRVARAVARFQGGAFYAYRFVWTLKVGPIPFGMVICHHCDNPMCVKLDHLFLGTQYDNVMDMVAKRRHPGIKGKSGQEHHMVRHSDELVGQVSAAWDSGKFATYSELGRAFGLSKGTARDWAIGRSRTIKATNS